MKKFWSQIRGFVTRPHVRPWALSVPIVVLLVCLPLLRPLQHPEPRDISEDESNCLATVQALVDRQTLALEPSDVVSLRGTIRVGDKIYSNQPPVMAWLLSGPYWVMDRFGLTREKNPALVPYLLTVLGVTLPVALATALLYRMGRLFELSRPWRALLALGSVFGSGLLAYAVVLNAHAAAASLLIGAAACLVHVSMIRSPARSGGWIVLAGFCASLAAVIDISAGVFAVLLALAILAMRWRVSLRIGGVLMYVIGATAPVVLHAVLTVPVTGDIRPGLLHPELAAYPTAPAPAAPSLANEPISIEDDAGSDVAPPGWWAKLWQDIARCVGALIGTHGVFSHYPAFILGLVGIAAVMHRHWPTTTKMLAGATLAGAVVLLVLYSARWIDFSESMYAGRWFIVFAPLMLFWSGAWLRKGHKRWKWGAAGALALMSVSVSLIGALHPFPKGGFDGYTVSGVLRHVVNGQPVSGDDAVLAGG